MSARRKQREDSSGSSDALADIALNSLGLILIILLIYVLLFQDTTRKAVMAANSNQRTIEQLESDLETLQLKATETEQLLAAAPDPDAFAALQAANTAFGDENQELGQQVGALTETNRKTTERAIVAEKARNNLQQTIDRLNASIRQLDANLQTARSNARMSAMANESKVAQLTQKIDDLQERVDRFSTEGKLSGVWRFRINVKQLVDERDQTESVNWVIDYFVWLDVRDRRVTGMLFGVNEVRTEKNKGHSSSHGKIRGTVTASGSIDAEIFFSEPSGGSEHLRVKRQGDTFIGRLESGKHHPRYRNYVGPVKGERLTESVFSE